MASVLKFSPFNGRAAEPTRRLRRRVHCNAADGPASAGGKGISEDVLARLRAAEAEAAALREQLAQAQATQMPDVSTEDSSATSRSSRIDGGDLKRETIFTTASPENNWLTEGRMSGYLAKNAPGEVGNSKDLTSAEQEIVQRRLIIGVGLTAAAAAFALVPTEELRSKPTQPLFFYLVPVLRSQQLLQDALPLLEEGNTIEVTSTVRSILGPPNNLKDNMVAAAAGLTEPRDKTRATELAYDVYEYVLQVDYNKYFESMRGATPSGSQMKSFTDFSYKSAKAAIERIKEYIALMPRDQREAAQTRLATSPF